MPRLVRRCFRRGKHAVDAVEGPPSGRREAGENQVLLDVEAAEDAPLLVHELHARPRDDVALLAGQLHVVERHRARPRGHDAHQALQRGALAGAVAPEEGHHLVLLDAQADVEQDVRIAVEAVQPLDLEQAHATSSSSWIPPR